MAISRKLLDGAHVQSRSLYGGLFEFYFPQDNGWESVVVEGTCELGTTQVIQKLLTRNSVVFDIGANIGWFTVVSAQIASEGSCHSFEPVPSIFEKLQKNCSLNFLTNVHLNNVALGNKEGEVALYTFDQLPHGHSSMHTMGRNDFSQSNAKMITLDYYLESQKISNIDFVKLDVEGAELLVCQGGMKIFDLKTKPIWVIEMNEETSQSFNHTSSDVLEILQNNGEYVFFRIIGAWGNVVSMASTKDYRHGDNVCAVPVSRTRELYVITNMLSTYYR